MFYCGACERARLHESASTTIFCVCLFSCKHRYITIMCTVLCALYCAECCIWFLCLRTMCVAHVKLPVQFHLFGFDFLSFFSLFVGCAWLHREGKIQNFRLLFIIFIFMYHVVRRCVMVAIRLDIGMFCFSSFRSFALSIAFAEELNKAMIRIWTVGIVQQQFDYCSTQDGGKIYLSARFL